MFANNVFHLYVYRDILKAKMEVSYSMSKTIFWAEDDNDDMLIFLEVLSEVAPNFSVIQFGNGKLLINQLDRQDQQSFPSLIILDLNMPVMDGRETLKQLKSEDRYKNIPTVVFTTSSNAIDRHFCESMNTEVFVKPLEYAVLRKLLEKIVAFSNC